MGTIRVRDNGSVELRITHPVLAKPYYSTHESEQAAGKYATWIEAMLDRGQVPPELQQRPKTLPLKVMMGDYLKGAPIATSDIPMVKFLQENLRVNVGDITILWAEQWVRDMKQKEHLSPGRIRKRVESLARAIDWYYKRNYEDARDIPINPLRVLPKGYSAYKDGDAPEGKEARHDVERDRRLAPGEEQAIEAAILGEKKEGKQRALELEHREAFLLLWRVIVNTGLRLREAYRLRVADVRFDLRTIHVAKSKTGTKRDIPMTKQVHDWLHEYVKGGHNDLVFPFWDGEPVNLDKTSNRLSHIFARMFDYAGCVDLTEHDLRHEATCRWMLMKDAQGRWLFRPEEVRKITGHKTERMFMRYYSLRGSDLAERLW